MKLDDQDRRSLALWAADCAERVLPHFEEKHPEDDRPRIAVDAARSWARGEIGPDEARAAAFAAHAAARDARDTAACATASAAGHAASTAHVANFARHAGSYALSAAVFGSCREPEKKLVEHAWQRQRLPAHLQWVVFGPFRGS